MTTPNYAYPLGHRLVLSALAAGNETPEAISQWVTERGPGVIKGAVLEEILDDLRLDDYAMPIQVAPPVTGWTTTINGRYALKRIAGQDCDENATKNEEAAVGDHQPSSEEPASEAPSSRVTSQSVKTSENGGLPDGLELDPIIDLIANLEPWQREEVLKVVSQSARPDGVEPTEVIVDELLARDLAAALARIESWIAADRFRRALRVVKTRRGGWRVSLFADAPDGSGGWAKQRYARSGSSIASAAMLLAEDVDRGRQRHEGDTDPREKIDREDYEAPARPDEQIPACGGMTVEEVAHRILNGDDVVLITAQRVPVEFLQVLAERLKSNITHGFLPDDVRERAQRMVDQLDRLATVRATGRHLVPSVGVARVAVVMLAGEEEHGDRWKTRDPAHHLKAAERHIKRHKIGEPYDHDLHAQGKGKHSHLACAGARILMALHLVTDPETT